MKIGILTFHFALNYGAVLQTYALSTYLKELGYDVYIIDRIPSPKTIFHRIYELTLGAYQRIYWQKFLHFSEYYLQPRSKKYDSFSSLLSFSEENFDAVIVGSDQVWRFELVGLNYFLDFVDENKTRKISYAASFGKDHWEKSIDYTENVKRLLSEFSSISVREEAGVSICKDIFDVNAVCVLDPTLLVERDFYETKLLKKYQEKKNDKIVSYFLGSNPKNDLIPCAKIAKSEGLLYEDLWFIESQDYSLFNLYRKHHYLHITVEYWLNEIRNAKYVITNSFHATVFAILFKKQFIVIDLPGGGSSRIESLTKMLGLEDRYIKSIYDLSIDQLNRSINYDIVETKLDVERQKSKDFLLNSLK